jgi:thymidylate kinase
LVRHLLPPADLTLYLTVPVELALARKPGDTIGRSAVTRQVQEYEAAARHMQVCELSTTAPVDEVVERAWSYLVQVHPAAAT